MVIAVDFDGTIVEHKYPEIGKEKPFAIQTLRMLQREGNRVILFTSREGELLDDAIAFCHDRGLDFYAVNSNQPPDALFPRQTSKVIADVYIDDRNLGMAQVAISWLAEGKTVFFAVGTGHMVGDTGLVRLLTDAGYTVERVE